LDAIAPHLDEITGSIAARAICEFGIDTATLHWDMTVRHEALSNRAGMKGPRRLAVAAVG
jgi:hypothetical protein